MKLLMRQNTRVLVVSGHREAALNFRRLIPTDTKFRYDFLELESIEKNRVYDGCIVFHKSAISQEITFSVGRLGVAFFFMEPSIKTSYVNKRFLNQFDVSFNAKTFPFKTDAIEFPCHITTSWVGLTVEILSGKHRWISKPAVDFAWLNRKKKIPGSDISFVGGDKNFMPGHRMRRSVEVLLAKHYRNVTIYGSGPGRTPLGDKYDALKSSAYHIVVENSQQPGCISEKVIDCFLSGSTPIYWGPETLSEFFPAESYFTFSSLAELTDLLDDLPSRPSDDVINHAREIALRWFNPFAIYERTIGPISVAGERRLEPMKITATDRFKRRFLIDNE